ncbi:replication endonuclease [Roseateles sp.]|uniref:replication endonuclease n=1 Tax=Roseateles sp. TaxID=1971397 RepID=UPI002E0853DE|nr:replication endonuclease [Roseateles sp.]HEV6967426.1 replication endonuclease [Roseateles sp.]
MRGLVDPRLADLPAADWVVPNEVRRAHREAMDSIPDAWVEKLQASWRKALPLRPGKAVKEHLARCKAIRAAHRAGVPADANDGQLCQEAAETVRDIGRRVAYAELVARIDLERAPWCERGELAPPPRTQEQRERLLLLARFAEALHWLEARDLAGKFIEHARRSIPAALRRLGCERFWRRILRDLHARAVETTARAVGLVHKRAGCYVSDQSLKRRQGQRMRNERALESVVAVNEHGQDYTLAELAAKGPANRQIRRMELMTRIAGFELIAKELGHVALFITITCPSRMHAWRTKPGQKWVVEENQKHDGTTVDQAQAYLCEQWRKFSVTCQRQGLELYGFRIAEPNHDGTPHWHLLLFFPPKPAQSMWEAKGRTFGMRHWDAACMVGRNLRRYFLCGQDSNERGAQERRIVIEPIDWTRGTAAGYIAKYVSKNIDGYRVEKDLYGNDTLASSLRVDTWASTWHIRQFQQVGGAPVGVWRELRRLHPDQGERSEVIAVALDAANVTAAPEPQKALPGIEAAANNDPTTAAHGWAAYLHLQGGHRVRRAALRVGLLREQFGELGRYGELVPPKPVGVQAIEVRALPDIGLVRGLRKRIRVEVESERCSWLVVPKGNKDQAAAKLAAAPAVSAVQAGGEAARPWSPVNNCTPAPLFGPSVERHKKRGRWHRWVKREPGGSTHQGESPCPASQPPSSPKSRPRSAASTPWPRASS